MNRIEQLQDEVSAIHETAEDILQLAEDTKHKNPTLGGTLSSISLVLKGQTVLAEIMLEILKSQK
jgi:hypothetical protein